MTRVDLSGLKGDCAKPLAMANYALVFTLLANEELLFSYSLHDQALNL